MSRQPIVSAAMCALIFGPPAVSVARGLTVVAASSTSSPRYARIAEDGSPTLAFGLISPFLSQMIVVFLDHSETGIVPIVWRFQSGDASKRKCQRLLRVGDGRRHHLWLIFRRAVVGGNQVIVVGREHRNHYGSA